MYLQFKHYSWAREEAQIFIGASSPVERLVWNTYGYLCDASQIALRMDKLSSVDVGGIEIDEAYRLLPSEANLVIVVGESLGRRYMHSYGYPLPNTPRLDSLIANGDMLRYTDVASPSCWTIGALTRILSLYDNWCPGDWLDYPTLMMMLRKVYPRIEWMSTQESRGSFVQPLIALANTSSSVEYVSDFSPGEDWDSGYDEAIFKLMKPIETGTKRRCDLYHLMGSHMRYDHRYPVMWSRFTADDIPREDLGHAERSIIAHYMNSVYYNDYVVSEIIRHYANTPSIVIYFSDHGEALYDDPSNRSYAGHAFISQVAEIPFLVYISPKLQRMSPKLYERVKASADYPIMMDTFADALLGILGVKSKYTKPAVNFWGDDYDPSRVRVIHGAAPGETLVYEPGE